MLFKGCRIRQKRVAARFKALATVGASAAAEKLEATGFAF
jgi:hypothetical protein